MPIYSVHRLLLLGGFSEGAADMVRSDLETVMLASLSGKFPDDVGHRRSVIFHMTTHSFVFTRV